MSSKTSTPTLPQEPGSSSASAVRATVTGVDIGGQLFRDAASVIFLKHKKCIYVSKFKPSPDGSVMIEMQNGKESWRSNAKLQSVLAAAANTFRITVELERAHPLIVQTPEAQDPPPVEESANAEEASLPRGPAPGPAPNLPPALAPSKGALEAVIREFAAPESSASASPPAPSSNRNENVPTFSVGTSAEGSMKPVPAGVAAAAPRMMVADIVRSVMASEVAQLKRDMQALVAGQVEAALHQPLDSIDKKIEQRFAKQPASSVMTEESVRRIAGKAAENAQIEWATTSQKIVAEAARAALASDSEQRRREIAALVSGEIEAALRGPVAARMDAKLEKSIDTSLDARMDELTRKRPTVTEETVRQLAAQVAEGVQLQWASTKLQTMVAEAARSALASDANQRRAEIVEMVSGAVDAAVRGPVDSRIDAKLQKSVEARMEEHSRKHPPLSEDTVRQLAGEVAEAAQRQWVSSKLQTVVTEAARSALAFDANQRRTDIVEMVSGAVEAAVRGPIANNIDTAVEKTTTAHIERNFDKQAASLQAMVDTAVRQRLQAEYEQRTRQVQTVVSNEIQAAVRGPIAEQMDEMLSRALEAQRAEYLRTPPPISEEMVRMVTAGVAQHPQLLGSIDALAANLTERWTDIARGATVTAQQDVNTRIAATERLANEVVLEIQNKLASFSEEMNRILGAQEAAASGLQVAEVQERDNRFRDLLQSTGSHFEREMKAALQKIFGKS